MDINQLKINPKNPRIIKKDEFERLKKKIREFPEMLEKRPIVYDENNIVLGGNQRLRVLQELVKEGFEIKDEYFKSAEDWTEEQKRKFVILDNISDGSWDNEMLGNEWSDLPLDEWGLVGKWSKEIEEDEVPEVSDEPAISKLGEVYQLGRHRLMCGDSTRIKDVEKLMNGQKADMVFTDPPYNVNYKSRGGHGYAEGKFAHKSVFNDNKTTEEFQQFLYDCFTNVDSSIKKGTPVYIWHNDGGFKAEPFYNVFKRLGWTRDSSIIWVKNNSSMGWQFYRQKHETCSYGWKAGKPYQHSRRDENSTWEINKDATQSYVHPTQKPVSLGVRAIKNSSKQDDIVLDLFGGSGSTLIAAEQTNRTCYMMELDAKYCDVIRKRYAKFIGKEEEWQKITPVL